MKIKIYLFTSFLFISFFLFKDRQELEKYNLDNESASSIYLPKILHEISGIAITKDNRLFAEEDNHGRVYQIDFNTGKITKIFSLGNKTIREDFEDITIVNNEFFMITSDGYIYKFSEGKDRENVVYKKYLTGLTSKNNVEGMCYDPESNSLLLACKDYPGNGYDNSRAVYSFSLLSYTLDKIPRFLLPIDYIKEQLDIKNFRPSGIARHPGTGTFFILSAHSKAIIEVSKEGKIINLKRLTKQKHNQPEGITFTSDNSLYICDEGDEFGKITKYPEIK
jgi:uncharacterized protein YjiK